MECTLYTWVYSFTMVMMYYTTVVRTPQCFVSWTVCNLFFSPLCIQRSTRGAVEDEVVRCSTEKQPEMPRFQSSNQMYFLVFKPWIPKNCFGFFGISLGKKIALYGLWRGKTQNPTFSFPKEGSDFEGGDTCSKYFGNFLGTQRYERSLDLRCGWEVMG